MRQQAFILRIIGDKSFDGTANHGILAHQHGGVSSESLSDFVHLLRTNIVDGDDEDGFMGVEQRLKLVEVSSFASRFAPHDSLWNGVRIFKGKGLDREN